MSHPSLDIDDLPPKQREVLEQIMCFINETGYPPSIQQLCQICGVSSTSTIHHHMSALRKKGFIDWDPAAKRSITIHQELKTQEQSTVGIIPMLGTIAAGSPLQTVPDAFETINLSEDICPQGCYALKVKGLSMIDDHILDGDIVIINPKSTVRDGDVVVALVDQEMATLKRIYRERDGVRLQPANAEMEPIFSKDVQVQGKVEAIIRKLRH